MTDKPSRNEDEYFVRQEAELLKEQRASLLAQQAEAERRTHFMKCPKDGYDLASSDYHGVQVDICPHCGGLWLDKGEIEAVTAHEPEPGLLGRVMRDVLTSLRGSPPDSDQPEKPVA